MGDGLDWDSPIDEVRLYVELPFWLMVPAGQVDVEFDGLVFSVEVLPAWREVFIDEFTDSRISAVHQGPDAEDRYVLTGDAEEQRLADGVPLIERRTKTMIRIQAWAHRSAFLAEEGQANRLAQEAYWSSLCETHIPVLNTLIQRYRLTTYDYFAYEMSAWDVPVWYLRHNGSGYQTVLLPYKAWDRKPHMVDAERGSTVEFKYVDLQDLDCATAIEASPGEYDLLDARSLMERGDFSGAVRRTTTAIETLVAAELEVELLKMHSVADVATKMKKSENDFPGRLRQWIKLTGTTPSQPLLDQFQKTRQVRHGIVHRGERLTHADRGRAQQMIDAGRWLYNQIENKQARRDLREKSQGFKSVGRSAMQVRFPAHEERGKLVLGPIR
jgi:hypothetical protein